MLIMFLDRGATRGKIDVLGFSGSCGLKGAFSCSVIEEEEEEEEFADNSAVLIVGYKGFNRSSGLT
jgi:hypothetical protein